MGKILRSLKPSEIVNPGCLSTFAHDSYHDSQTHLLTGGVRRRKSQHPKPIFQTFLKIPFILEEKV